MTICKLSFFNQSGELACGNMICDLCICNPLGVAEVGLCNVAFHNHVGVEGVWL